MKNALNNCIGTKFASRWGSLIVDLALKSLKTIMKGSLVNKLNTDLNRYVKVEKAFRKFSGEKLIRL